MEKGQNAKRGIIFIPANSVRCVRRTRCVWFPSHNERLLVKEYPPTYLPTYNIYKFLVGVLRKKTFSNSL